MPLPQIPAWVPPLDTGQPSVTDLNDLSTKTRQTFAARNSVVPITYGRDRIFGRPFVWGIDDTTGHLYVGYSYCEGEIQGFESLYLSTTEIISTGMAYFGLKNRGFETGDYTDWTTAGDAVEAAGKSGTYAGVVASLAGGPNLLSDLVVAPAQDSIMTVTGSMQRKATNLPDANASIAINWYTSGLSLIGSRDLGDGGAAGVADFTVAGWQDLTTNVTVPATAAYYQFDFGQSVGTTGLWYCDDASTVLLDAAGTSSTLEVVAYSGTSTQRFDSMLAGVLNGYEDDLPNLAYVVLRAPPKSTSGFPRLEAVIQGRKVYDPRKDTTRTDIDPVGSGAHRVGDSSTWEYSAAPVLCFRDLVENFTGWDILDQGVVDLAVYNEESISGLPRREIGLTLAKADTVEKWAAGFRTYMGAFLGWEEGKLRVVANKADVTASGVLVLDGTAGTWANVGDFPELDFDETQNFTVEAKFKTTTTGSDQVIAGKLETTTGNEAGYCIFINAANNLTIRIGDATTQRNDVETVLPVTDGEFHHIAMTIDQAANEMTMILDDTARAPVDITAVANSLANGQPFRIGAAGGTGLSRFTGEVDEVRVWNTERNATQLSANIDVELPDPGLESTLVGYWRMNDSVSGANALDYSLSRNDATLAGAAVLAFGNPQLIPEGVAQVIDVDDIVKDSLKLVRRTLRATPNSVAVDYEDSSGARWVTSRVQSESSRVTDNLESPRLSRVSLPGIHNASQAKREATERLNWYLTDLECTLTLFDPGWCLQHGSIVAVTHPIGLDAKLFRVRRITARSGRLTVDLVEYDPAIYSNEVIANPTIPDTNLGDPLNPPTVANLVVAEELFNYKNGITGSRVRVSFDATGYSFLSQYLVEGYVNGAKVWQTFTGANNIVTPSVEEIVDTLGTPTDYEVRVYVQSPFAQGASSIGNVEIQGKFAIPGDASSAVASVVSSGSAVFSWAAAVDIDIWRYEVRRGLVTDTWETATALGATGSVLVDGLSYAETGLSIGMHRYFVKAIDSVKQESANAAFADVSFVVPDAVAVVNGFEVASEVRLNWSAVTTGFVARYRVAYSDIPETFEITLDIVDTLRFQTKDVPEGTFTFKVYSRDALDNEASTAATIDIEVTSDADAFLADSYDFINPGLTNMVEYDVRIGGRQLFVTHMGDVFVSIAPSDFTNYAAEPLANYHSAGASQWLSEAHDFGLLLTGSWNLTQDVEALKGTVTIALELSTDDVTYAAYGGSAKGSFRYARVRITTLASPGTATGFIKSPIMNVKINVVPLEESGSGVSSAVSGTGAVVNLSREYTALKEIVVQPKNTIASGIAVTAIVDNIIVGSNTGVQTDTLNSLTGGDIAAFDFGASQDFSVELRMDNKASGGSVVVCGKRGSGGLPAAGWVIELADPSGNVSLTIGDGTNGVTSTLSAAVPKDGLDHHIAFTVDRTGDLVRGYVDSVEDTGSGSPFDISTVTGALDATTNAFRVFSDSAGTGQIYQSGRVDELRVWDDIRTAGEIAANYELALDMTVTQSNLIAYWSMDGDPGAVVTTVTDLTTNAYVLTDSGAGEILFVDPGESNPLQKRNSFDVYVFDIFGQQLAENFQWKWKAV